MYFIDTPSTLSLGFPGRGALESWRYTCELSTLQQ